MKQAAMLHGGLEGKWGPRLWGRGSDGYRGPLHVGAFAQASAERIALCRMPGGGSV